MTNIRLTADAVVFARSGGRWHLLLIQRKKNPFQGRWALPGGHVDDGESTTDAAVRELAEETGLLLSEPPTASGAYAAPDRDPRGRYVSFAYTAVVEGLPAVAAADDARAVRWTPMTGLDLDGLAFDHGRIVADAFALAQRVCPLP